MFAVEKMDNVYIASHSYALLMPEYLFQFPDFVKTLDALYSWKRHHIKLEDILLPAVISLERNSFFSSFNTSNDGDKLNSSPNTYFTPTKSKKH